jgi:hypothetical protein
VTDRPMTLAEVAAESRSRMSDQQKVQLLREVVADLITRGDLGFHDYGGGQGCANCAAVERARNALTATEN